MKIGIRQNLVAVRATVNGLYFADKDKNEVLLPKNEVESNMEIGDVCELFIYKDSEDRLVATKKEPFIHLGELKRLRVIQVTKIGAFLDWGLSKDLFLPFKEQTELVIKNASYLVGLYVDKSGRLCATMRVYKYLENKKDYKLGQEINGTVYKVNKDTGALIALEDKFFGFIPKQEMVGRIEAGDNLSVRIVYKRADGKFNVSMRKPINEKMDDDAKKLLRLMREFDGELIVTEKDTPEKIQRICGMSKSEFKRAVGRLLKDKKIFKDNDIIKLVK